MYKCFVQQLEFKAKLEIFLWSVIESHVAASQDVQYSTINTEEDRILNPSHFQSKDSFRAGCILLSVLYENSGENDICK